MNDKELISRTQKKKADRDLQKLGEELVGLPVERLKNMDMPVELLEELLQVKNIKTHGARRRQILHIGSMLRKIDTTPIAYEIERIAKGDRKKRITVEQTREYAFKLASMDKNAFKRLLLEYPDADVQRVRNLARTAGKELNKAQQNSRALQKLLGYLKELAAKNP